MSDRNRQKTFGVSEEEATNASDSCVECHELRAKLCRVDDRHWLLELETSGLISSKARTTWEMLLEQVDCVTDRTLVLTKMSKVSTDTLLDVTFFIEGGPNVSGEGPDLTEKQTQTSSGMLPGC